MSDFRRVCKVDSWTNQEKPRKNYAPTRFLRMSNNTGQVKRAYLFFALPDAGIIDNGITIVSAHLKVYLYEAWAGGPHTVTAKRITQKWKESKITHQNNPTVSATNAATDAITGGAQGDELLFNVTDIVSQVANGAPFYGFRLEIDSTSNKAICSGETLRDGKKPVLEVVYTVDPDAPTRLRPNGEFSVVSPAAPTFSWNFNSDDPQESQGESRVEVFSNEAMTTSVYDSGWEVNTETEWDSSLDASPPSLSTNTQYWWRVTVRDSAGNESVPSDGATFWRVAKGTLTIDEPTSDNDNVDTTTPLIEWTYSATQERWMAILEERLTGGRWRELTRESLVSDTVTEWQIENGWIRYPEGMADYRVTVRVWDAITSDRQRQAIPGDATYVEAVRVFQYQPQGVPAAPTSLLATHEGAGLLLTWFRSAIPDEFVITANDEVWKVLDPADVSLGGGNYEYRTYRYKPQQNVVWGVRAVVNDQTSNASTYSLTTNLEYAWLVDEDDEVELGIAGQANFTTVVGESGETFFPIGRRAPVRIVDSVRGLEGTFNGLIIEHDGVTAEQWYQRAIALKSRTPGTVLRLIYGRHNIPVVIGEMEIDQHPEVEHQHDVSIPFWQVGNFDIEVG